MYRHLVPESRYFMQKSLRAYLLLLCLVALTLIVAVLFLVTVPSAHLGVVPDILIHNH